VIIQEVWLFLSVAVQMGHTEELLVHTKTGLYALLQEQ
jgi:hypothetical protein